MKKVFTKPLAHFIPLADGVDATTLANLSDDDLASVVRRCKEAEAAAIYRINPDIIVREVAGQWVLIPTGKFAQQFNGMISLNLYSHFVWQQMEVPKSLGDVLLAAREQFDDDNGMLDIQIRKLVSDYFRLGLLLRA